MPQTACVHIPMRAARAERGPQVNSQFGTEGEQTARCMRRPEEEPPSGRRANLKPSEADIVPRANRLHRS